MESPRKPNQMQGRSNPFDKKSMEQNDFDIDALTTLSNSANLKSTVSFDDSDEAISCKEFLHNDLIDYIEPYEKDVVEKLSYGTLSHFLPQLQKAKSSLAELTENQRILYETVQQENGKFDECQARRNVSSIMKNAVLYQCRLWNIKKEMLSLHEKSAKLKMRAVKLQQQKQKEELTREQAREKEIERERLLIAKRAKKP